MQALFSIINKITQPTLDVKFVTHKLIFKHPYGTLLIFYGTHMAAFYCAQLNRFKLELTFFGEAIHYTASPYLELFTARLLQSASWARLTDRGVKYEAVTTIFSERALPAFNGLTYIPVQRANTGSLVEVLELHNVTHRCPTQQDPECSISCFYRLH